ANITYTAPGEGQLVITAHTPCGTATDTLDVVVHAPFNKMLDLGPDRTVCDNGVFTFNAGSGFAKYRWQNGSPDSILTTLLPGKYWVDVYDPCGNRQSDTVVVKIAPATKLALGPDRMGCPGLPATFQLPGAFTGWQWSPATFLSCDTCATVTATPAATTTWTVLAQTAAGCLSLDTLHWGITDTLFYSRDTTICVGQTVDFYGVALPADTTAAFLRPSIGPGCDTLVTVLVFGTEPFSSTLKPQICPGESFHFQGISLPADTTAVFYRPGPGCDTVVTVQVNSYPPILLSLPADTSLLIGSSLTLPATASGTGPLAFQWQPGTALNCTNCLQPLASPLETITYTLQVTDGHGCSDRDSITLRVNPDCNLIIPNAFTPNGDGINDWFYPAGDPCLRSVRLWRVVDRWGQVVFERRNFAPNQENLGWNGEWQGKPVASDVLVWMAELEYFDGRLEIRKGELTLLR
ncbi:MAG: gliding motility-associated C-terminal domain-containing protein, partial [Saprospiraceae bacterium]